MTPPPAVDLAAFGARAARVAILLGLSRDQALALAKALCNELAEQSRK